MPRRCCSRAPNGCARRRARRIWAWRAGGVALNCVANGRIAREAGFDNIWIQPAAGDDGVAIGCAYYGYLAMQKNPRPFVTKQAFLGRAYRDDEVKVAV